MTAKLRLILLHAIQTVSLYFRQGIIATNYIYN